MALNHGFVSLIPDDPTAAAEGKVLPSHWNAEIATDSADGEIQYASGGGVTSSADLTYSGGILRVATSASTGDLLTLEYTGSVNNGANDALVIKDSSTTFLRCLGLKGPGSVTVGWGLTAGSSYTSNSSAGTSHTIIGRAQSHSTGTSKGLALSQAIGHTGTARGNLLDLTISSTPTGSGGTYHVVARTGSTEVFTVDYNGCAVVNNTSAAAVPITVIGAVSQSGNYIECNSSSGSGGDVFAIASSGNITVPTGTKLVSGSGGVGSWTIDNDGNSRWVFNAGTFTASGNIIPSGTTRTVGSSGSPWSNIYSNISTIVGGTVTTSTPPLAITQTWNAGAVTFDAIDVNVTNTASATASKLINLRVGSATQFSVTRAGNATATGNLVAGANKLIGWTTQGGFLTQGDGIITLYQDDGTSFNRLQWGGTSASFPSIKRNGAALNFRLANDSADCDITAKAGTFSGGITPASMADASAANGTLYYSTDAGKLVFKDSGGTVNALY